MICLGRGGREGTSIFFFAVGPNSLCTEHPLLVQTAFANFFLLVLDIEYGGVPKEDQKPDRCDPSFREALIIFWKQARKNDVASAFRAAEVDPIIVANTPATMSPRIPTGISWTM